MISVVVKASAGCCSGINGALVVGRQFMQGILANAGGEDDVIVVKSSASLGINRYAKGLCPLL